MEHKWNWKHQSLEGKAAEADNKTRDDGESSEAEDRGTKWDDGTGEGCEVAGLARRTEAGVEAIGETAEAETITVLGLTESDGKGEWDN